MCLGEAVRSRNRSRAGQRFYSSTLIITASMQQHGQRFSSCGCGCYYTIIQLTFTQCLLPRQRMDAYLPLSVCLAGRDAFSCSGCCCSPRAPHEDNRPITVTLSGMCVFSLNDAEVIHGLSVCRAAGKHMFTLCGRFSISFDSHFFSCRAQQHL